MNNRQFKFRIWDILNKEYSYAGSKCFLISLDGFVYDGNGGIYDEEHIIQQYTGLQDKHGKDIYEGDIVIFQMVENGITKGHYGEIKFGSYFQAVATYEERFHFGWYVDSEVFFSGLKMSLQSPLLRLNTEIAGNIFENPELLK